MWGVIVTANQNTAYDFALFEEKSTAEPIRVPQKKSNVIELPKERLQANRKHKARLSRYLLPFFAFLVIAGLVGTYINGEIQLCSLTTQLNSAQKTLQEQQDCNARLKLRSDCSLSMEAVENYATQKLGMKPMEDDQVITVQLTSGDKSEVVQKTAEGSWAWLQNIWNTITSFLS
jgi:cell division protein FtsL